MRCRRRLIRLSIGSIRTCRRNWRFKSLLFGSAINRVIEWSGDSRTSKCSLLYGQVISFRCISFEVKSILGSIGLVLSPKLSFWQQTGKYTIDAAAQSYVL